MNKTITQLIENGLFLETQSNVIRNIIEIELKYNFNKIDEEVFEKFIYLFKWHKLNRSNVIFNTDNLSIEYTDNFRIELKIDFKQFNVIFTPQELRGKIIPLMFKTDKFDIETKFEIIELKSVDNFYIISLTELK